MSAPEYSPASSARSRLILDIFGQMQSIAGQCGSQFPLYRRSEGGPWKLSRRGSWLGGFWAALWWHRAQADQSLQSLETAREWTRRLEPILLEESVNRSFVFWYGAATAHRYDPDASWSGLAERACAGLRESYSETLRMFPLGEAMGGGPAGRQILNVDALASLLLLLHDHGDSKDRERSRQHLDTCLLQLVDERGRWRTQIICSAGAATCPKHFTYSARGQAWAMLGLAQAVRCLGEGYTQPAMLACKWWTEHTEHEMAAPLKAAAGRAVMPVPEDPCASAIACLALHQLGQLIDGQDWLQEAARRELSRVLALTRSPEGLFAGHLYAVGQQGEHIVETPCALYFLLQAVMAVASD